MDTDPVREKLLDAEDKRLDQAAGGATMAPSAAPKEEPYTISILPEKIDKDCIVPQDNTTMQVLKSFKVPEYDAQPHRVFERIPFIRTGGMYGNCYLIWGDLSSRYFPFICLFPAQYMMWLLTFSLIVIINTAMMVYSVMDNRMIGAYVCVALGVLTLIFFFLTSLSNPGIAPRGKLIDYGTQLYSYCRKCEITRPLNCLHCPDCNFCVYNVHHHCVWMGKCIGKNNKVFFFLTISFIILSVAAYMISVVLYQVL